MNWDYCTQIFPKNERETFYMRQVLHFGLRLKNIKVLHKSLKKQLTALHDTWKNAQRVSAHFRARISNKQEVYAMLDDICERELDEPLELPHIEWQRVNRW